MSESFASFLAAFESSGIGRLSDLRRGLLLEGIELIGELLQGDRCAHRDETDSC